MKIIKLGLENYYGEVEAYEKNGKYFMGLDSWDGRDEIEISKDLFEAIKKEFTGGGQT